MQLTIEQIECINQTLNEKGIKFDDIKLEVLDHIATEIEAKMDENAISFDENFKIVLDQWSEEIKPSSSILTGLGVTYPKIILEKKVVLVKKQLLIGGLSSVVVLLLFLGLNEFYDAKVLTQNFQLGALYVFVLGYIFLILNTIRIWNSKLNVSFYRNHRSRLSMYVPSIYPFCFMNTQPSSLHGQVMFIVISTLLLFHLLNSSLLAQKHFQFEKKLSRI